MCGYFRLDRDDHCEGKAFPSVLSLCNNDIPQERASATVVSCHYGGSRDGLKLSNNRVKAK